MQIFRTRRSRAAGLLLGAALVLPLAEACAQVGAYPPGGSPSAPIGAYPPAAPPGIPPRGPIGGYPPPPGSVQTPVRPTPPTGPDPSVAAERRFEERLERLREGQTIEEYQRFQQQGGGQ